MCRTDWEALAEGAKLEEIQIFSNPSEVPSHIKDTPNAFFIEVELVPTSKDIKNAFFQKA